MPLRELSNPDRRLREGWDLCVRNGADGTPLMPPKYVAEAGPRVWLVDIRDDTEMVGPLGHIPGVWRMPMARVGEVASLLPRDAHTVLICSNGERATTATRFLRTLGMARVAAMESGMVKWRQQGYGVSRAPSVLGRMLHAPVHGHGADGRPLVIGNGQKAHLTRDAVEAHVGDTSKVRRVKLAAFLLNTHTECVDGREDQAVIGTPGGDAGELVLGIAAAEKVAGKPMDLAHMPDLVRAFADTFGGIYLHTDNSALHRLSGALGKDRRFEAHVANLKSVDAWEAFLRRPPKELENPLLDHLEDPNHIGCGHLKLALKNSEAYNVRPEIIKSFFQAYYRSLWDGASDFDWVVLGGEHAEGAVAVVEVEGNVSPFSEVPMIAPSVGGVQMFVHHPQVAKYLREQTSYFLSGYENLLPMSREAQGKLEGTIYEMADAQMGATLEALAKGLPLFNIQFARSGGVVVKAGGHVSA